jgi:N-acetylglucosaminyldiphosphoundecaprenol N-acetyl-beta-D-mannosaminyltransferase
MSTTSMPMPFGLRFSSVSAAQLVSQALDRPRTQDEGVGLVVTPNIEHIALLRRSPALARAYGNAAAIVCDGWPVHLYVRAHGPEVPRVTGCEIASVAMQASAYPAWSRLFFVADREETVAALDDWAARRGLAGQVASFVPPFGFELDSTACRDLAGRIAAHGTTLLMMGVGAPRSEIFVDRHRDLLPPCWAFCVGQAVKVALGLVQRAPPGWQAAGMEWLWRVGQEPRRLAGRYARSSIGFALAVLADQRRRRARGRLPPLPGAQPGFAREPDVTLHGARHEAPDRALTTNSAAAAPRTEARRGAPGGQQQAPSRHTAPMPEGSS